jgi:hypothetical protein
MRLLPSQQAERVEQAKEIFHNAGSLTIYEPCNCGGQVRHNNGGNYHDIVRLAKDGGQVFIMNDTTSELEAPAEWEPCEDWQGVIEKNSDWL